MSSSQRTIRRLLDVAGRTYADEAGIRLRDTPAPLYRLLVLSVLLSTRISASIAVAATRELIRAGFGTPKRMRDATWQQRVDALGRGHYVRYDESTATALGEGAQLLLDEYQGDLRKLRDRAGDDPQQIRTALRRVPRLGPVGVDIFCREVQLVWPALRPYVDRKAVDGARKVRLPASRDDLGGLVDGKDLARFTAGLVRVSLDRDLAAEVRAA